MLGCLFDQDVTQFIFAGEVPPNIMYRLLTEEWKMGPYLASLFIACFGGHIWNCSLALRMIEYRPFALDLFVFCNLNSFY